MKTLGTFILGCFMVLIVGSFAQAETRYAGTYAGGYLSGSDHAVSEVGAPCPEGTYICKHTHRTYGPHGYVDVRTTKHCVPYETSGHGNAYGHRPERYYQENVYNYAPPRTVYRQEYHVYQPPVVVRPRVTYQTSPYYGYYDGYYGNRVIPDTLAGGAFGAAAGAAIGAILGSPGDGAAIGAVIGGFNALSHGIFGYGYLP
jgi:hypothetical protein